jgi:hypothetical protein
LCLVIWLAQVVRKRWRAWLTIHPEIGYDQMPPLEKFGFVIAVPLAWVYVRARRLLAFAFYVLVFGVALLLVVQFVKWAWYFSL